MYVCTYLARSLEIPAAGPSNLGCHTPRSAVRNRSCTSAGIALRLFLFLIFILLFFIFVIYGDRGKGIRGAGGGVVWATQKTFWGDLLTA